MVFNLIHEKWIWVNRQDGKKEQIAPWEITDKLDSNPIISLAAPRPDFNGSMIQFLIGLVQTTMSPKNEREWRKYFINPPTTDDLQETFGNVSNAFNLDGENERFMQDYDSFEGVENRVDVLLMEMPGEKTIKDNTDHFIKRDNVSKMCFSCCATALFNLQLNAPSGGQGHRTSLRGGGPLTTLVMGNNLWQTIWLNIISEDNFERLGNIGQNAISDIYPWMGSTRTSEKKGTETTPMNVNPKQMYWGMPRRISIDFNNLKEGFCDVCGCETDRLVSRYVTKNYGVNYEGGWCHVLSPHRETKDTIIPLHPGPGGITYRHWLGLVQNDPENGQHPSLSFERFVGKQLDLANLDNVFQRSPQLWAFGYDFDNMKVRCWYESIMPLFNVPDHIKPKYESIVSQLIKTAEIIGNNTYNCIKKALFSENQLKDKKKYRLFDNWIDSRFCQDTESDFYHILNKLISELDHDSNVFELKIKWIGILSKESEKLFDEYSQSAQFSIVDPERIAIARRDLRKYNSKGGKKIRETLGLPKKSEK
jgi:CRISPR system Cascade subunit CasA